MHRRIRLDCGGKTAREVLDHLGREIASPRNGRRVVLLVENLREIQDSLGSLLRQILAFFNERELKASIVDPSGCTDTLIRALGGSVHIEVCRSEAEVTRPLEILLVEDTPDSLEFVQTLLESAGHKVTAVATGREAVRAAEAKRFDLVLLDLVLPDTDGVSLARALPRKDAKLIAMSAYLDRWSEGDFIRAGFRHTLRKPFKTADLLDALRR